VLSTRINFSEIIFFSESFEGGGDPWTSPEMDGRVLEVSLEMEQFRNYPKIFKNCCCKLLPN
jgi:hypothetical protein